MHSLFAKIKLLQPVVKAAYLQQMIESSGNEHGATKIMGKTGILFIAKIKQEVSDIFMIRLGQIIG